MNIRFANISDLPELVSLGRQIHKESRLSKLPFAGEKLAEQLKSILDPPNGAYCILISEQPNDGITGVIMGYVTEYMFSNDLAAMNYVYYVKPGYRGSSLAIRLLTAFRKWAQNRGTALLFISQNSGSRIKSFHKFMGHVGLQYFSGSFSRWIESESNTETSFDNIRVAEVSDIPALVKLGEQSHAESRIPQVSYSANKFERVMRSSLIETARDLCCVFIAECKGSIAGALIGSVKEYFFSRARTAATYVFYVLPQFRGGALSLELIETFQEWARDKGAHELIIYVNTWIHDERFARDMSRWGFDYIGGNYFILLKHQT